ncbi:hypothetical protein HDV01_001132 [Terramyces sp. JEL0728]|nr:hypothetical protein HDV01_001132 [Terramyces sp. JEL0728]
MLYERSSSLQSFKNAVTLVDQTTKVTYQVQMKNIIAVFETGHALVQIPVKNINDPCEMETYIQPHKSLLKVLPEYLELFDTSMQFYKFTESETELFVFIQSDMVTEGFKRQDEVILDLGPRSLYADISNHDDCENLDLPVYIKVLDCEEANQYINFEEIDLN